MFRACRRRSTTRYPEPRPQPMAAQGSNRHHLLGPRRDQWYPPHCALPWFSKHRHREHDRLANPSIPPATSQLLTRTSNSNTRRHLRRPVPPHPPETQLQPPTTQLRNPSHQRKMAPPRLFPHQLPHVLHPHHRHDGDINNPCRRPPPNGTTALQHATLHHHPLDPSTDGFHSTCHSRHSEQHTALSLSRLEHRQGRHRSRRKLHDRRGYRCRRWRAGGRVQATVGRSVRYKASKEIRSLLRWSDAVWQYPQYRAGHNHLDRG